MANKRLSLMFYGLLLGVVGAFAIEAVMSGNYSEISYDASPVRIKALFWMAGIGFILGILFQPDKKLSLASRGVEIGSIPLDNAKDWIFLVASAFLFLAAIEAAELMAW
jgi:hypothetical protein